MTLTQIAARRWQVALSLSAFVVVVYFGFVLLVAFDKPLVAKRIAPGLSLGILLGALVIVAAWGATWFYVHWANSRFDRRVSELRAREGQS